MTNKTKLKIILVIFSLIAVFFYGKNYALAIDDQFGPYVDTVSAIDTRDVNTQAAIDKAKAAANIAAAKKFSWDEALKQIREQRGAAFKAMLASFLNNMAADTATYLVTGNWGQHPMFETKDFGSVLKYAADNAAGTFIEQLGNNNYVKFNLCKPDLRVLLKINLGLRATVLPKPPACTFSKLTQNWEQALKSKNFLPQFQDMFNPWSNDLGIALTLQTGMSAEMDRQASNAGQELIKDSGFKAVKDQISGYIKSPSSIVGMQADAILKEQGAKEKTYTGTIADAIDVFINTLAGKLLDKWLKKGLVTSFPPLTSTLDSLTNPYAQNQSEGAAGAADRMSSLLEPNFKVRGDYNVLNELATCPDPNKAGPTNCVIDEKFRQAIEKRLTVGQALEQGYLNGNGIFGFTADGLEPRYNEGYPYRSMLILRKFRIIPVGWEAAAQYIKDCQNDDDAAKCQVGKVEGTKNLKDLVSCTQNWCKNLVDPNWVLKAPQNFCAREGAGPIVTSEQIMGQGADSSLSILRDENYCADEKSLIKENSDGSNPRYGYCTEERRTWDFNSKSCEPRDNTCQTFKSPDGQTVSYLQNTLDYGNCTAGNAGCLRYAVAVADSYNSADKSVKWSETQAVYLNKNAETCEAESEGCHQLIRLNSGGGANLLVNSDFEERVTIGDWDTIGTASSTAYQGAYSLEITKNDPMTIIAGADGYNIAGESWTLSFYSKNCSGTFNIEDTSAGLASGADWAFNKLSYVYPQDVNINKVNFSIDSSSCLIDNIKLEKSGQLTAYGDYGAPNQSLVYEKLLPGYLQTACYNDNADGYTLKDDAPAVCSSFARRCKRVEAGCELYTGVNSGLKIPAQVKAQDYCPAECVGYNTFVQSQTSFADKQDAYFIPKTAKTCSAQAAGCEQFTNLDEVAKGGEGIEYYTALRQCRKPDAGACTEFYTWEGSDESGFQLKVESLEADNDAGDITLDTNGDGVSELDYQGDPASTMDRSKENDLCNQFIYNLSPGNPAHNDNCRQYYNRDGNVSYHLLTATKFCTNDCHPYRKTEPASCTADTNCAGGGKCASGYCVYNAIPKQGRTCSAAQNGCREYTGNTGNNVRNIFTDDFEADATTGGWQGVNATVERVNDSIILQNNTGHSILVSGSTADAKKTVGTAVSQGKSYVLSFLAKAAALTDLNISLATSAAGAKAKFIRIQDVGTDWQVYKTNLANLDHQPTADEFLLIEGGQNFYLDNLALTEITDRYYLIKDSWRTPAVCDQDLDHQPSELFMLGCDQYQDRSAVTHNLKQFNKLCSESAVGCEMMKDTKNSANPGEEIFNGSDADSKITVLKDDFIYAIYDQSKLCGKEDKGCERLGQPYVYDKTTLYGDVYLKNNPDSYGQILCDSGAVGCQTWAYNNGAKSGEQYFKDPGDQACEWRVAAGSGTTQDWYKKKVKRCDDGTDDGTTDGGSVNGAIEPKKDAQGNIIDPITSYEQNICLSDSGCSIVTDKVNVKCSKDPDCGRYNKCVKSEGEQTGVCHNSCITDNNDYRCPKDTDSGDLAKTLGAGGNSQISQPGQNASGKWAGICQPAASGCNEYLDPISKFNTNIIFNGDFHEIADNPTAGWESGTESCPSGYCQSVNIEPNTVYRLARLKKDNNLPGVLSINCPSGTALYVITGSNALTGPTNATSTPNDTVHENSKIFYYKGGDKASCEISVSSAAGAVELKPVVVDYQLAQNLDSASCNGTVDFDKGCVLFNERSQDGASKKKLDNDADIPVLGDASTASERDSNVILKVTPDRTCNQWLACKSYVKDDNGKNVCYDAGLCDGLDDNGNCSSFLTPSQNNQIVGAGDKQLSADAISNLSGYSEVGLAGGSLRTDYYPLGVMEQKGELANLSNGGFETAGTNGYPIGWTYDGSGFTTTVIPPAYAGAPATTATSWNTNIFKVINNPIAAQSEGIEPAPEGRNFLKLGSSFSAASEQVDVISGIDYIITAYVNTKNLKTGQARIDIADSAGASIAAAIITQDLGSGWQFKLGKFKTEAGVTSVKIKLYAAAADGSAIDSAQGNFYFDDIKIRPALNSKDDWYTSQSCRLYPQTDSLSCDYYDDAGKRQKGWYGYCLQYDRPPGDPNACLLWYPIDKVKGDGIEEGAGYQGKAPVYYCANVTAQVTTIPNTPQFGGNYNVFWANQTAWGDRSNGFATTYTKEVVPGRDYEVINNTSQSGRNQILPQITVNNENYLYVHVDDVLPGASAIYSFSLREKNSQAIVFTWSGEVDATLDVIFTPIKYSCLSVVEVVSPSGQNKYWSGRVYEGSGYHIPLLQYGYITAAPPFGSMTPPAPVNNPYEWDADINKIESQPIYINNGGTVSAGSPYAFDRKINNVPVANYFQFTSIDSALGGGVGSSAEKLIQRIFAQSYDGWQWQGTSASGRYVSNDSLKWLPPEKLCNNNTGLGSRPDYKNNSDDDLCAIPPTVTNVYVANSANSYTVNNTGFINLTFNSNIDGQQLPLVMYAVAWGDGATTTVSGVSMRDRSNPNLPHSLYHLYSYWDLKAKANSGVIPADNCTTVDGVGQCSIRPKVQIKDNWGWCNGGGAINDCSKWEPFPATVVVKEK